MSRRKKTQNYGAPARDTKGNEYVSKGTNKSVEKKESKTDSSAPNATSDDPIPDKAGHARSGNDPEWYSRDNQLVVDAASLPFADPLGDEVEYGTDRQVMYQHNSGLATVIDGRTFVSVPGICTIHTKASFGSNSTVKDPLNVAANMIYAQVRAKNSGRKNYDPADLMLYIASMADVYSFVVWAERIYAKAFIYSQRNKFIGNALLKSENIDADDVKRNLANFRYYINTFINKLASYAIPADVNYFKRRVWIYSGLYLENPDGNIKDQLYQFTPDGFYRFDLDNNSAGMLKYATIQEIIPNPGVNGLTVADIMSIGEWMWEKITGDEDFGLMSGDIVKAFDGNIIGLTTMPEEVDINPVYSEYVLEQIHNCTILEVIRGASTTDGFGDMTQDPTTGLLITREGVIDSDATMDMGHMMRSTTINMRKMLTVNSPLPNPVDVMEVSRLTLGVNGRYGTGIGTSKRLVTCSSDIVVKASICYYKADGTLDTMYITHNYYNLEYIAASVPRLEMFFKWRIFKYAPIVYYASYDDTTDPNVELLKRMSAFGEVNNYTIVDNVPLNKMHEVALLSLLTVPGIAKVINYHE